MKLFVYADESGTFERIHDDIFVYGGIVVVGEDAMQNMARKFSTLEKRLRSDYPELGDVEELKGKNLSFKQKSRLFKGLSIHGVHKFCAIVDQRKVYPSIYSDKKSKQRFMDYALKRAIKSGIIGALSEDEVTPEKIDFVKVTVDEHTTSTNGYYTLMESVDEELRHGLYRADFSGMAFEPIFPTMRQRVQTHYADSKKVVLVRAADIVANWMYCAQRDYGSRPDVLLKSARTCPILRLP